MDLRVIPLVSCLGLFATACVANASPASQPTTGVTSLQGSEERRPVEERANAGAPVDERDLHARSLVLYGRARVFDLAGRCGEARDAYQRYAALVRSSDPESADMALAYGLQCWERAITDPRTTQAAEALIAGDYAKVLASTESESSVPAKAWLDHDRASALAALGRTDEAVEAFKRAEVRFRSASNDSGRAVAIWGRANALAEAGRCGDARAVYEDYAAFVRVKDPRDAEMAAAYSGKCRPRVTLR